MCIVSRGGYEYTSSEPGGERGAESKLRLLYKNDFAVHLQPPSPVMMARRALSSQLSPPTLLGKEMWHKFTEFFNPHYNAWTSQNSQPRAKFGLHQLKGVY